MKPGKGPVPKHFIPVLAFLCEGREEPWHSPSFCNHLFLNLWSEFSGTGTSTALLEKSSSEQCLYVVTALCLGSPDSTICLAHMKTGQQQKLALMLRFRQTKCGLRRLMMSAWFRPWVRFLLAWRLKDSDPHKNLVVCCGFGLLPLCPILLCTHQPPFIFLSAMLWSTGVCDG